MEVFLKATDALLADHKLIRKVLSGFTLDNPRFPELAKTLHRTVVGHAWFEDEIFLPALIKEPRLLRQQFTDEIFQEHKDIQTLLELVRKTTESENLDAYRLQLVAVLSNHLKKEEDALFPLAERILNEEGLNTLGAEMKRRQTEIRNLVD
jgi:iron-sulfur cluster repair protein YtfE (RIC family)